jgi:hypothetical protein
MDLQPVTSAHEAAPIEDKDFSTMQAQLALSGVELHRFTGAFGREAYSINVQGQLRTLDTLPQVVAYARCLGVGAAS